MNIIPMTADFILYRCIHVGPLSPENIDKITEKAEQSTRDMFARNKKFFRRIIETYGSCAMLAMENDHVIAHTRFLPQVVSTVSGRKEMCCQQPEYAPTQEMVDMDLPSFKTLKDRSLRIHCWHIHKDYRNKGLSHALLDAMINWARDHDWKTILASAGINDPWVASLSCAPMLRVYLKHGFKKIETVKSPELLEYLKKFRDGEFGDDGKQKFHGSRAGEDLLKAAVYYRVKKDL